MDLEFRPWGLGLARVVGDVFLEAWPLPGRWAPQEEIPGPELRVALSLFLRCHCARIERPQVSKPQSPGARLAACLCPTSSSPRMPQLRLKTCTLVGKDDIGPQAKRSHGHIFGFSVVNEKPGRSPDTWHLCGQVADCLSGVERSSATGAAVLPGWERDLRPYLSMCQCRSVVAYWLPCCVVAILHCQSQIPPNWELQKEVQQQVLLSGAPFRFYGLFLVLSRPSLFHFTPSLRYLNLTGKFLLGIVQCVWSFYVPRRVSSAGTLGVVQLDGPTPSSAAQWAQWVGGLYSQLVLKALHLAL